MAKAAVAARSVEFDSIDRLEEKVKLLVGVIDRLRADSARAIEENARLKTELDSARARLADTETSAGAELAALRDERAHIRTRVDEMLRQIDALNL